MQPTPPVVPPMSFPWILRSSVIQPNPIARPRKGATVMGSSTGVPLAGWLSLGGFFLAYLSYQAGRAMAPTPKQRLAWGLMAIPAGMFAGPFGLGIMGLASVKRVDKLL